MFSFTKESHRGQGIQGWMVVWGVLGWLCLFNVSVWGQFSGGSGTQVDPYLISDPNDLQAIGLNSAHWDKHFKLTGDLDLTGVAITPIGSPFTVPFVGTFDGNNHTLANLTIYLPTTFTMGLFGPVQSAFDPTIFNLGLINPDITGTNNVGALAGYISFGTISGCYADGGSVTGNFNVGGLVGQNETGAISDSYAACTVTGTHYVGGLVGRNDKTISDCYSTGQVTGTAFYAGGLVGRSTGTISNSYAACTVNGNERAGGLVGETGFEAIINYCYATGVVNGTNNVGGLVGYNAGGTVSNSFWDTQTSGQASSAGGTGKTTVQMKQQATFTGWDFVDTWGIFENKTYPLLKAIVLCVQDGTGYPSMDGNKDCLVDMLDFVILFQTWLEDRSW